MYLELEVLGLPQDGVVYLGGIREGVCDAGGHADNTRAAYGRASHRASVVVRLDLLSGGQNPSNSTRQARETRPSRVARSIEDDEKRAISVAALRVLHNTLGYRTTIRNRA